MSDDSRRSALRWPVFSFRTRLITRLLVAALSLTLIIGGGLAWAAYKNFTSSIPHGLPVPALAAGQPDIDGSAQNILLVGNDSRAGASPAELLALGTQDDGGTENADTMMVLHIPAGGGKPTIVSFPRDSWVSIPGYGVGKINAAYPDGYNTAKSQGANEATAESAGIILTIKTISALTGLHIDHYMQVNLLGFYRISNAIGGVTVCLLHAQNANTDSDAFGKGYSGINLPAGVSVIEGTQALAFVRQRHGLPNGDLDRIRRQQYFLASALHKIESAGTLLNPFKLHKLLNAVGSSLLTDPTLNPLSLAQEFEALSAGSVSYLTIPNEGAQTIYPDGVETSIVAVDKAAIPGFIRQLEGKPADPAYTAAIAAPRASVTVDVLNGTELTGLAGRNAAQLKALGFRTNTVDSADLTTATTVEYPAGQEAAAKALATVVKGAKVVETSTVSRPTLVLGTNGVQVTGLAASSTATSTAPATTGTSASTATTGTSPAHSVAKSAAAKPTQPVDGLGCIN
jgi:LCP family protein required for cell wall assembly